MQISKAICFSALLAFALPATSNAIAENSLEAKGAAALYQQRAAVLYLDQQLGSAHARSVLSSSSRIVSTALTLFNGGAGAGLDVVTKAPLDEQ